MGVKSEGAVMEYSGAGGMLWSLLDATAGVMERFRMAEEERKIRMWNWMRKKEAENEGKIEGR